MVNDNLFYCNGGPGIWAYVLSNPKVPHEGRLILINYLSLLLINNPPTHEASEDKQNP